MYVVRDLNSDYVKNSRKPATEENPIRELPKELNGQFSKEDVTNGQKTHEKTPPPSVLREMLIRTSRRSGFPRTRSHHRRDGRGQVLGRIGRSWTPHSLLLVGVCE